MSRRSGGRGSRIRSRRRLRRKRLRAVQKQKLREELARRHGWVCQLCGGEIDPALPAGTRLSASLDHVVPIGAGGGHDIENLQLAHLRCNLNRHPGHVVERPS